MAEALPSFSAQYIERLLECAICLERFKSPKLLPCQHTFCCLCLVSLVDPRRNFVKCPSCRVTHRVPVQGAGGFPNNLTITALLDIPTCAVGIEEGDKVKSSPMHDEEQDVREEEKPCVECGTLAKVIKCFHCERDLCSTCKQCHKQNAQDEITGDLLQIHQKIVRISSSLQDMRGNMDKIKREKEVSKLFIRESIESICKDLREQGSHIMNSIDKKNENKIVHLQVQLEKIAKHASELETFHQVAIAKMKQPISQLSDEDIESVMNQSCKYLGRAPRLQRTAVQQVRRQASVKSKGKRPARSNSSNRASVQRPSMRRLQSLSDIETAQSSKSTTSEVDHQQRRASAIPAVLSADVMELSERQDARSPPPKFTIGVPSPEQPPSSTITEPSSPPSAPEDVMDTTDVEQSELVMGFDETQFEASGSAYSGIIVKAIIGKRGARFWNPSSICISPLNGTIIVVDSYKNLIQILDSDGHFVTSFGTSGNSDGQFDYPSGCVCDKHGNIIITDAFNHRVQILDRFGRFLCNFGQFGTDNGCLEGPSGIALDNKGYIYIADTNNNRIQVFDPLGGHVHTFGTPETLPQNFKDPRFTCLAISQTGDIFVSDSKNHCIHIFSYTGTYMKSIGKQGSGLGEFSSPRGLALDQARQLLLVADRDNHRVQVFTQSGDFLYGFGSQGERAGQLHGPEGVALADNGDIVVAECGGQRVQMFTYNTIQAQ